MITSTGNRRVKWVRALQTRRRARQEEGAFVIEGVRLGYEVVAAGMPVWLVFHSGHLNARGHGLVNSMARLGAEVHQVSEAVMVSLSATDSPPGLLAVLPIPKPPLPDRLTLALALDRLADPGNLGTLLRTARAVGVEAVFLTEGSVDAYNPKVVRAAMGAHVWIPIHVVEAASLSERLEGLEIWLADAGGGVAYHEVDWRRPTALCIGSESHGPSAALGSLADGRVHVPMPGGAESLNVAVAGAVILFEIIRQRGAS